jgi:hypothetical protein
MESPVWHSSCAGEAIVAEYRQGREEGEHDVPDEQEHITVPATWAGRYVLSVV